LKISYAITVCNEIEEIKKLVSFLLSNKRKEDEIVVLADSPKMSQELQELLRACAFRNQIRLIESEFKGHFADWKNLLTFHCTGDYIFQIDADEMPSEELIANIPYILEVNRDIDVFRVPRINTVEGLTQEYIQKWRWNVDSKGWVNFPDYQWRIYKNTSSIKWKNKVHEVLEGYQSVTFLPAEEEFCLYHPKTIEKQVNQNNYYDTL